MNLASAVASMALVPHATLATGVTANGPASCGAITAGGFTALGLMLVVYLAIAVVSILAAVKVATKAGYSGWWVLIAVVPLVGFVMVLVFAFSDWPVLREVRMLRARASAVAPPFSPGYGGDGGAPGGRPGPGGNLRSPGPSFSAPPTAHHGHPPPARMMGTDATDVPMPPFHLHTPVRPAEQSTPATDGGSTTVDGGAHRPAPTVRPPAGWYPTPDGRRRYWDGTTWTEHYA